MTDDNQALKELEIFLEPRIKSAHDETVNKTVKQIFEETHQEMQ